MFSSAFVGMIGGLGIMYILFSNMEAWKNKDLEEYLQFWEAQLNCCLESLLGLTRDDTEAAEGRFVLRCLK